MTKNEYIRTVAEKRAITPHTTGQDLLFIEMLRKDSLGRPQGQKRVILQALASGKPVPAAVLKDYPELGGKM